MKLGIVLAAATALVGLASPSDAAVGGDVVSSKRRSLMSAGRPLNLKRMQPVGDGFQAGYRGSAASPHSCIQAHQERAAIVAQAAVPSSDSASSSFQRRLGTEDSGSGDPARDSAPFMQFPLFGGIESLGYYYTFVSVGDPNAQPFSLILVC